MGGARGGATCTGVKRTAFVFRACSGYGPGSGGRYDSATTSLSSPLGKVTRKGDTVWPLSLGLKVTGAPGYTAAAYCSTWDLVWRLGLRVEG